MSPILNQQRLALTLLALFVAGTGLFLGGRYLLSGQPGVQPGEDLGASPKARQMPSNQPTLPGERHVLPVEPHTAASVQITVRTPNEVPIRDASILGWTSSGWKLAGSTDGQGKAELQLTSPGSILIQQPLYRNERVLLSEGVRTVTVVLEVGGAISGILHGAPNPGEWIVAAVSVGDARSLARWTVSGELPQRTSKVDATGRFSLTGLDPTQEYDVVAVSEGAYAGDRSQPVLPGPPHNPGWVDLEARDLWAAHLVFDGPDLQPARFPAQLDVFHSRPQRTMRIEADGLVRPGQLPTAVFLQAMGERGYSQASLPCYFVRDTNESLPRRTNALVPHPMARFSFQLPGYELVEGLVQLEPASASVTETHIAMVPLAEGWGSLNHDVTGTRYLESIPPSGVKIGYALKLEEQGGAVYSYIMVVPFVDIESFGSVPAGTYKANLVSMSGVLDLPLATFENPLIVESDAVTTLELELAVLGAIQLRIFEDGKGLLLDLGRLAEATTLLREACELAPLCSDLAEELGSFEAALAR